MSRSTDDKRSAAAAGKPTLEELLRLKRAERPDAAFWEDFERGLRQKQLAAIIEPKPWWLGLSIMARRLAPVGLPVSAAAAALLAVMVLRTEPPVSSPAVPSESLRAPVALARLETPRPSVATPARDLSSSDAVRLADDDATPSLANASGASGRSGEISEAPAPLTDTASATLLASLPASDASDPGSVLPVVEALLELGSAPVSPTASERTITENLAALRLETPELVADASSLALDAHDSLADDSLEPALKMEVRNPRHARVLLAMADNPSAETPGRLPSLRERYALGLDREDSLSGSASRLGVGGDRFSVSF